MSTLTHLSNIRSGSKYYIGNLDNYGLNSRWDVNNTGPHSLLLLPSDTETDNFLFTNSKDYTVTGSGQYGVSILTNVFVSKPITSGNLVNTFSGQVRGLSSDIGTGTTGIHKGYFAHYGYVSIMNPSGACSAVLGTFIGSTLYPLNSTLTNRTVPITFLDNSFQFTQTGYRFVIELGVQSFNYPSGGNPVKVGYSQSYGKQVATANLPIDETNTSGLNPWVRLEDNIQ